MYVRMYVCMYVCTYVRMYVCMYLCIDSLARRPNHTEYKQNKDGMGKLHYGMFAPAKCERCQKGATENSIKLNACAEKWHMRTNEADVNMLKAMRLCTKVRSEPKCAV